MPLSVVLLYLAGTPFTLGLSLIALVVHWLVLRHSGKRLI